jgi:hypothetical protein
MLGEVEEIKHADSQTVNVIEDYPICDIHGNVHRDIFL